MGRRNGKEDEQSSKTVTLIAFACQNRVVWRESQGKNEQSTVCSRNQPSNLATSSNGIFYDLNYFRFFHKLPIYNFALLKCLLRLYHDND